MISILMATYNGEEFLEEQLESLMTQTFDDFVIYVNDDCSTDKTWEILCSYAEKYPNKIKITRRNENSGAAKHNFLELMVRTQDDYIMLCDQDDVWLSNKIELTLAKIKEMEQLYSAQMPLLAHTDLRVVDRELKLINPSYRQATARVYGRTEINQVLTLNNASGCTIMYNRALAELLVKEPKFCVVHDWWLQIVAAYFGKIGHVDKQTILYRQHGRNDIGAKDVRKFSYKMRQLLNNSFIKKRINSTYPQAESLLEIYKDKLTEQQINLLEKFIAIPHLKKIERWRTICSQKLFMDGFSRNVAYFMFV